MTGNWEIWHNHNPDDRPYSLYLEADNGFRTHRYFDTKREAKQWAKKYMHWMKINKQRSLIDQGKF